jgi:hypothetical protein
MTSRIGIVDWIVFNIAVPIPALRTEQLGNDRIRLEEAVDIRRNRPLQRVKK